MFVYNPLWKTLVDNNMNKTDLTNIANLTNQTVADMGKNKNVSMETLNKICNSLKCEISDIIKHIPDSE